MPHLGLSATSKTGPRHFADTTVQRGACQRPAKATLFDLVSSVFACCRYPLNAPARQRDLLERMSPSCIGRTERDELYCATYGPRKLLSAPSPRTSPLSISYHVG